MLDFNEKQNTRYCVDEWLRDEQIKINRAKVPGRLQVASALRAEPIAVVGFGPSLNDTWEKIREFKFLITCSGAHRFLLEKGLKPEDFEYWWHAEVDPRDHKIALLGPAQPGIHYLPCSAVHPTYLDHLVAGGATKIDLWHSFTADADAQRVLGPGEWATCGGQDIGQRALVLARLLGFTKLHGFGIDGCFSGPNSHAAEHPKWKGKRAISCEYPEGSNTYYQTTPSMLDCARNIARELDQLKDVEAVFYGDGLTAAVVRNNKRKAIAESTIALATPVLISENYRQLNAQLHNDNPAYGTSGEKEAQPVLALCQSLKTSSVLDYGCGKGRLAAALPFPIWEYDPAIPGKDMTPRPADIVVCGDVLEHIEPEHLDSVLADLKRCVLKVGLFIVHTGPAQKTLADGRNAHLIQQDVNWWAAKLSEYFEIGKAEAVGIEARFVVGVKTIKKPAARFIEHKGTKVAFLAPNDACIFRAKTLITKEPATIQWIESFEPSEVFWDVGACVGGYSVWAGKHRGVTCYAFEPAAENFAILTKNLRLNNIAGAAYPCALTDAPVSVSHMYLSSDGSGSSCNSFGQEVDHNLKPRTGIEQGALGLSGDKLIELGVPAPHHIKIDVDGLEHAVIAGMAGLLAGGHVKSLLIEVNPALPGHQDMLKRLAEWGYDFSHGQAAAARRTEGAFKGIGEVVFRKMPPVLKAEAEVLAKIAAAPIIQKPFPHIYLEDVFPADFYPYMMQMLPLEGFRSLEEARGVVGYPQRSVAAAPECVNWLRSGRLRRLLDGKFGVESVSDETLLLRDAAGYVIGPHTDTPKKGVTALFYVPQNWTEAEHGTSLYVPKDPAFTCQVGKHYPREGFDLTWSAPGKPNSVFIFARTDSSFHGCEPYEGTGCRDILLYDTRK